MASIVNDKTLVIGTIEDLKILIDALGLWIETEAIDNDLETIELVENMRDKAIQLHNKKVIG